LILYIDHKKSIALAKIGDGMTALEIFHKLEKKDTMAWTSMIIYLAKQGHA
jgi:hypothetical protein